MGSEHGLVGPSGTYRGAWRAARPKGKIAADTVGRNTTPPLHAWLERALRGLALPAAPRDRYPPSPS